MFCELVSRVVSSPTVLRAGADEKLVAHLDERALVTCWGPGIRREQRLTEVAATWATALYRVSRCRQVPEPAG